MKDIARQCRCGTRLASDNKTALCSSCRRQSRHLLRDAPDVPAGFWSTDSLRDAFADRHMGRVVSAYRTHPHHGGALRQAVVAGWVGLTQAQLSRVEHGPAIKDLDKLIQWAQVLHIPQHLLWFALPETDLSVSSSSPPATQDDELAAVELLRRVSASDVGAETLTQLELTVDELAIAYPATAPSALLPRLRRHLGYVNNLMDSRMTLAERRRLVVVGGWLSLLSATVLIDIKQLPAASAHLRTATEMARSAGHREIQAWCRETEAWQVLTDGDYRRAVELSQVAQQLAPVGSSVAIQAAAQEGRAWARLGDAARTHDVLGRVSKLVSGLTRSAQPEHHYRYDPDKSITYMATTLAWIGDPAAETFAREIIRRLTPENDDGRWPRRLASANLDLSLSLLVREQLDEACDKALHAITSGRVAPSNYWRAREVVIAVQDRRLPEAPALREAYERLIRGTLPDSLFQA